MINNLWLIQTREIIQEHTAKNNKITKKIATAYSIQVKQNDFGPINKIKKVSSPKLW